MRELINRLFSPMVLAILALIALIVYTVWQQHAAQVTSAPEVSDGKVQVPAGHADKLALKGYWRFYWQELLAPEQLHGDYQLAWLPARWNQPLKGGEPLPGNGYATYVADTYFEEPPKGLGLRLPTLYRSAKLWANGEPLVSVGRPGTSLEEEVPRDEIKLVRLGDDIGHHLQLVVQVSSFHHVDGGIHHPIVIDRWEQLVSAEKWRVLRGIFLMSSTLTLAIYLLVMWGNAHAGREYLYLGLGLFWYSVRIFGTEKLIYYLFPDFSVLWLMRAEYYGMFLCIPAYMLFIQALYPRDIHYWVIRGFWYAGVAASVITTLVGTRWFSMLRDPFEALCVVYFVYFIGCLILIVWRRRPWSALVSFLGGVIALLFVNEVLYYREVVSVHLTPWVYVFVALTSIIFLGQRLNALLSIESEQKSYLQKAVDQRTQELQKRLEELDEARRHALELAQKRSEFMAVLSHEIRTPLSGMLGAMRLIGRSNTGDKQLIGHAIEAGESLLTVVNDSLDVSRRSSLGKSPGGRIHVERLFRSVTELMAITAAEKGLALELDLDSGAKGDVWIQSDPQKIRQIVTNLLHNAIKFTDLGEVDLKVSLSQWRSSISAEKGRHASLALEVTDTGIGIDEQDQTSVFEEYVQVGGGGGAAGAGLGLAITRTLVEEMGGSIELQSTPGIGSSFTVVLPVVVVEPEAMGPDAVRAATPVEPVKGLRVLVVEDDQVNRTIVVQLLETDEHAVSATEHPLKALQYLQGYPYQLCLFDIRLPDMDGIELLERARALVGGRGPLFVALTANTSEGDVARYRAAGFDYVIEKPVDKAHLRFVLARALTGRVSSDIFFLHNDMATGPGQLLVDRRLWQNIVEDLGTEKARQLLSDAQDSLQQSLTELEVALGKGNLRDISECAHKIKSASKSVGMVSVATIAHHIESDPSRAFSALANLGNMVETSFEQLRA